MVLKFIGLISVWPASDRKTLSINHSLHRKKAMKIRLIIVHLPKFARPSLLMNQAINRTFFCSGVLLLLCVLMFV